MSDVAPAVAYIAEGKLYTRSPGTAPKLIESPFVQNILDRVERDRERGEWKNQGMAWNFASQMRGPLGGGMEIPADRRRIRFSGVCPTGDNKKLLYSLDTDHVGGLFEFELVDGFERRLYHRQQLRINDIQRHPAEGTLLFSMLAEDGTAHIGTMGAEGKNFNAITAGDAIDEAPSWVIGESAAKTVVFQSAGVGRDQNGFRTGLSSYAIMKLEVESGKMETLIEEDASDVLLPKMTADGTLYFIRRPYEPHGATVSRGKLALDMLLFPIRLAGAIVHFFNFFSLMFQRKPLITSGGPPREGPDQRFMMLWGKVIDAQKLQKVKQGESQALVPGTWQLIKRSPGGNEEVIARRVLAYDLCPDGSLIYTDGSTIYHRTIHGDTSKLAEGKLIERVAAL